MADESVSIRGVYNLTNPKRAQMFADGAVTPPVQVAPTFTTQPSLTGSTALGSTITVSLGIASGTPTPTLTGTLARPGKSPESAQNGATFEIEAADQGGTITLDVTATNSAGSATATATLDVPAAVAPAIAAYRMDPYTAVYTDVDGTTPAQIGEPVARWDAILPDPVNGDIVVPFTQPVLGARPVLMTDGARRYLRFGLVAVLECMDAPLRATFQGAAGFFMSAAIRTEAGPVTSATADAMVFKVTQGTTNSNGTIVPRVGIHTRRNPDMIGIRTRRLDGSSVVRKETATTHDLDHVITASYHWPTPTSLIALLDGASYDTSQIEATATGFTSATIPLNILIGGARMHPGIDGEWAGRIYGLMFRAEAATPAEAADAAAYHGTLTPKTPAEQPLTFEGFDGAYSGMGYHTGGGKFVGIRIDRQAGNDMDMRHFLIGVRGNLGKPLTLSILRTGGQPIAGISEPYERWRGAWAYDPKGPWHRFDRVEITTESYTSTRDALGEQDTVYVAMRPVFTNDRWMDAIIRWRQSPLTRPTASGDASFKVGTLPAGTTGNGRAYPAFDMYGFLIGTGPAVVPLTGNIHPDEHAGAYAFEGAIDFLLSDHPDAVSLRSKATFACYPRLNPQGRFLGWSRSEPMGNDANRIWTADFDHVPLSAVMRGVWAVDVTAPAFAIDYHDWSDRNAGGSIWRRTEEPGGVAYTSALSSIYNARTGRALDMAYSDSNPTIGDYWRGRGATWAATIEHGILLQDTWTDWQAYGVDSARAMLAMLP